MERISSSCARAWIALSLFAGLIVLAQGAAAEPRQKNWGSPQGKACVQCHTALNAALVKEWRDGAHGK
jgi:hypothetical protein